MSKVDGIGGDAGQAPHSSEIVNTGALATFLHGGAGDDGQDLLRSEQVLNPGYYWRAKSNVELRPSVFAGDVLLLLELIDFEGRLHSVKLLYHPRNGSGKYTMLIDDFMGSFEPCLDGESIRGQEQQAIMNRISELQQELIQTQMSPDLMIDAVKPLIDANQSRRQSDAEQNNERAERERREREVNLSKIHRRAARRSEAAGNPIALTRAAVGTNVSQLLSAGIDEGGVLQLREIADRQVILAQAQATWLTLKTDEIASKLKELGPYAAEKGAVALARSSDALNRASRIREGVESLDLYTGKGVDVFAVRDGADAPTNIPLMIVQGKRFMEEELAAHADVDANFDWRDQSKFFAELASNEALLNQVFPSQRCAISMAVARRDRSYGGDAYSNMMNNLRNQQVFLLVRNGGKVHVVYSATPSHEAASRLFPTMDELGEVFRGVNGSTITLRDVEFGERKKDFDDLALHYRRFLILLCGLDHRQRLFGEFYPPEQQVNFMSSDFQSRYMDFYADQEEWNQIGDDLPSVQVWMSQKNEAVQSGSRVFVTSSSGAAMCSPEMKRRSVLQFRSGQFASPFIATQEGGRYLVTPETRVKFGEGSEPNVKCYLDSKDAEGSVSVWWLCIDDVKAQEIERYLRSRSNWAMGVQYLRLFRRLAAYLEFEAEQEAPARGYLMSQATTHGGMAPDVAKLALDVAARNWRASRRGAPLPTLGQLAELNDILSLMAPPGYLPPAVQSLVQAYIEGPDVAGAGRTALLLTRSGPGRYVLYTSASAEDRIPFPDILDWRWVRRVVLEPTKTAKRLREVSTGFDWLSTIVPASEVEIRRWEEIDAWQNKLAEPIKLRKYAQIKSNISDAALAWADILRAGPGSGIPDELFSSLADRCRTLQARENRRLAWLELAIPVAVYGGPRKLTTVYMVARAESVLYTYGSPDQRKLIERQFVIGFIDKAKLLGILRKPLCWGITGSSAVLDSGHTDIHKGHVAIGEGDVQLWLSMTGLENDKRRRGSKGSPGKKGSGKPATTRSYFELSMNRAFDELAGVGPILRRNFYKRITASAVRETRFPFSNFGSDPDGSKMKAARKAILAPRYESKPVLLSPLVWSSTRGRSIAQALFVAPLRANGATSEKPSENLNETEGS